ncbi:MAG: DoxX family protein [Tidjanibacter sp.]|nr:DoxX family protein [Tidjanibacter sp.]
MKSHTQKNDKTPHTHSSAKGVEGDSCALTAASRADSAILFLRLFIGTILFTQAITKSQQYPWLEGEYPSLWGLSGADVVSLVGIIEAVAGALLAVGLFTRVTSAVMTVLMIGAAFLLFPHQSFDQAELKVVYGGIYIFLLIAGAGRYSLDRLVCMVRRE